MKMLRLALLLTLLLVAPALGQGCAMCKANAAAAPLESQRALKRGIVALLLPSLAAICILGTVIYKHRD